MREAKIEEAATIFRILLCVTGCVEPQGQYTNHNRKIVQKLAATALSVKFFSGKH